jgi:hypothetical protein
MAIKIRKKKGVILNEEEEVTEDILETYSNLDMYFSPEWTGLNRIEKVYKIIDMINMDKRFDKADHIGAIADLSDMTVLCINYGRKKNRLYTMYDWGMGHKIEDVKDIKKLYYGNLTAEEIRSGLIEKIKYCLLEYTKKFERIKTRRKEREKEEKRIGQTRRIDYSDEEIVHNLRKEGYSCDIIRELIKEPLLNLDRFLVEKTLAE